MVAWNYQKAYEERVLAQRKRQLSLAEQSYSKGIKQSQHRTEKINELEKIKAKIEAEIEAPKTNQGRRQELLKEKILIQGTSTRLTRDQEEQDAILLNSLEKQDLIKKLIENI